MPKSTERFSTKTRTVQLAVAALACAVMAASQAWAMPANPRPFTAVQPDGTSITLLAHGDEYHHWLADEEGFTVVRRGDAFEYAILDGDGRLAASGLRVGQGDPRDRQLAPGILPAPDVQAELRAARLPLPALRGGAPSLVPPSGTVKNLVVLCKFSDHTTGVHTRPQADYDILFNSVGGHPTLAPTGSVRDLYLENSYGAMTLNSTVVAWVTLPHTEAYYCDGDSGTTLNYPQNAQGMVEDALELVDPLVDFGQFDTDNDGYIDAIDIVHSGYGAEFDGSPSKIWSHRWALWLLPAGEWISDDTNGLGNNVRVYDYHTEPALWGTSGTDITRIGVIAHETGHFFGLPDFYDTDGSSEGLGSYGMMANSWGFDYSQYYPPHFCAFSKIFLGWLTPTVIAAPGVYTAPQVETDPTVFRINVGYPAGEYLLIENRQPVGHEAAMPQGGLCIWHIDEAKSNNNDEGYPGQTGWPANNRHYAVALLQADGNYDMEKGNNRGDGGDVYHAGGVDAIDETTTPNTDAYQDGTIIVTGNTIKNISAAGASMTFQFGDLLACTDDPDCDDGLYCNGAETCDGNVCLDGPGNPCGAGDVCVEAMDACLPPVFLEDFESGNSQGWDLSGAGNTATTGDWVFGDPVGTYDGSTPAQPEDAFAGSACAFTAQNTAGALGTDDVDSGVVYLISPEIDLSGLPTAQLAYMRWFYNRDLGEDTGDFFSVDVREDAASGWVNLETLGTNDQANAWTQRIFDLEAYITLTGTVQLRFGAADGSSQGNIIEAAIDDLTVVVISECTIDDHCDDGVYCNGAETCSAGECQDGTAIVCDDGIACTADACNEATDACDYVANDSLCDNGQHCDGAETCNAATGCEAGAAIVCDDGIVCTVDACNEATDACDYVPNDGLCDNGQHCDGVETCNAATGCEAGTAIVCDDGIACTADACNEATDVCDYVPNDSLCDNGQYCDGAETCNAATGCEAGTAIVCDDGIVCTVDACNEATDACDYVANDSLCDNGLYCDGAEVCDTGLGCQGGVEPCGAGVWCAETTDDCRAYGSGDFDLDFDVDLADFQLFQVCFGGSAEADAACEAGNLTGPDGAIDAADYGLFAPMIELSGPQ